ANTLISAQLAIAVWTPDAAIETDDHRAMLQQVGQRHRVPLRVRQRETRSAIADRERPFGDPGCFHAGDRSLELIQDLRREARSHFRYEILDLLLESHRVL